MTIFDDDTPLALIEALTPDVLVKGGDYQPEEVVGREEVEAAGGKLVIIPLVEGHSTTQMVHRAADRTLSSIPPNPALVRAPPRRIAKLDTVPVEEEP